MSLESEIFARLKDYSGMSALVGTRIYPGGRIPQNRAFPAIAFQKISSVLQHNFGVDAAPFRTRLQIDIYAADFDGAVSIRDKVMAALTRYRGGTIQECLYADERQDSEDDPKLFRIGMDFIVWHT